MTPEQFCYWLQGRAELMPETPPSADEWKMIREHLALTFKKVTPPLAPKASERGGLDAYRQMGGSASGVVTPLLAQC